MIPAEPRVKLKRVEGDTTESGSFLAKDPLCSGQPEGPEVRVQLILLHPSVPRSKISSTVSSCSLGLPHRGTRRRGGGCRGVDD